MSDLPRVLDDGQFSIMLRPCTADVLRHLLDPELPYVWIVGHYPNPVLEWWTCPILLGESREISDLEIRSLRYELLLPTSEFLARVAEFDGLSLYQMRRRVPNTLTIEGLSERSRTRVLIQNGLAASFYLPHAMECASFTTVERDAMERVLANDVVRQLAY